VAIYRPPKPRWPAALGAGLVCLALGFGIGYLVGDRPPDPADSVRALRTSLLAAAASLDVAAVEYEESVVDGEIVRRPEYEGALAALRSSRRKFAEVRDPVAALAPERVDPIDSLYTEVEGLMERRAPAEEVAAALTDLQALLEGETS
jgi:hypothetical protein